MRETKEGTTAAALSAEECLALLQETANRLGRLPKKSDVTEEEVARIKALFGPWPRALEAAKVKPPRSEERIQKTREKRIRAKRRKREAKTRGESGAENASEWRMT